MRLAITLESLAPWRMLKTVSFDASGVNTTRYE
jgi:hypothetical protein